MRLLELHRILGISPASPSEDVKRHYRNMIKQLHPDTHPGDVSQDKFIQVRQAYEDYLRWEKISSRRSLRTAPESVAPKGPQSPQQARPQGGSPAGPQGGPQARYQTGPQRPGQNRSASGTSPGGAPGADDRQSAMKPAELITLWGGILQKSPVPEVRKQAAMRLGSLKRISAYTYLQKALNDPDSRVRRASVEAVARIGVLQAADALGDLYQRESPDFRIFMVRTLAKLLKTAPYQGFRARIQRDPDPLVRSALVP